MIKVCVCSGVVLWNTYGECENMAVMKGHTGAVMDLHFSTDGRLVAIPILPHFCC